MTERLEVIVIGGGQAGLASRVSASARATAAISSKSRTDGRTYEGDQVVVATGPFQTPFVPAIS